MTKPMCMTVLFRNRKWLTAVACVVVALLLGYGVFIEPYSIDVRHVVIKDAHLKKLLGSMTVIHLSDLHIAAMGIYEHEVLARVDALKPDIIFLTGDYSTWRGSYEGALEFLSDLQAKIAEWAVLGEYDYSNSRKSCLFCHEEGKGSPTTRHGVRFLRDSFQDVILPEGTLRVVGTDLVKHEDDWKNRLLSMSRSALPTIVLSHNPLAFDGFSEEDEVLVLVGDTHGGQIPVPAWLWKLLGYEKNARYSEGVFQEGKKKMYVSRGIGTSHVPIRLFKRPEIVVLHFQ